MPCKGTGTGTGAALYPLADTGRRRPQSLDALRPRRQRLRELLEHTEMTLGSDLMTASLEGYAVLKVSGRSAGLDSLRQALSARFCSRRGAPAGEAVAPA